MAGTGGTCASCGKPMDPRSPYCAHCGARAPQAPGGEQAGGTPPSAPSASAAAPSPAAPQSPPVSTGLPRVPSPLTQRGFFRSLFDLSFTSLIATRIIKVLYVLSIIGIGLSALFFIFAAFHQSGALGAVVLIFIAPLFSLFYLIWTRVLLELFIALFRIMENTSELVAQGRREGSS